MNIARVHNKHITCRLAFLFIFLCFFLFESEYAKAVDSSWNKFAPPPDDKYDWIQLTSGEWLKGELKVLYNYKVDFDSDKLNKLTLDFEDVKKIRTNKPRSISIQNTDLNNNPIVVEGVVNLVDDKIIITLGVEAKVFERNQVIAIAPAEKKEKDLWSGKISLGINVRGGNTDTVDLNLRAKANRYTAKSRLVFEYLGNYSEADQIETSNNHRFSGYRDTLLSRKFFWRQLAGEYFRDHFKNIDHQLSLGTAIGYNFIRTPTTKWEVTGGLGGRYTKYVSVEPGQSIDHTSPAFGASTLYDKEVTKWLDFLLNYSFQIVNEDAGKYTHHFISTLSTELVKNINLDFSFIWDRIQEPEPDSDGNIPKKDDYQLILGLSYDI
jgi:putative salt-induced outer membrane protein YdiY